MDRIKVEEIVNQSQCCEKGLSCELCGSQFENLPCLVEHIKKAHFEVNVKQSIKTDPKNSKSITIVERPFIEEPTQPDSFTIIQNESNLVDILNNDFAHNDAAKEHLNNQMLDLENPLEVNSQANSDPAISNLEWDSVWFNVDSKNEDNVDETDFEFTCPKCSKKYRSRKRLAMHLRLTHATVHPKCNLCNKTLKHKKGLNKHMNQVHTIYSDLRCKLCNKKFKNPIYLNRHIKKHEHYKELKKKFSCHLCENKFSRKDAVSRHIKNCHSKNLAYNCVFCNKVFQSENYLQMHVHYVHSNDNVSCIYCGMSFRSRYNYRRHLIVQHTWSKLSCHICNKKVKYLKQHLENQHKIKESRKEHELHVEAMQPMQDIKKEPGSQESGQSQIKEASNFGRPKPAWFNDKEYMKRYGICEEMGNTYKKNGTIEKLKKKCPFCSKKVSHLKDHVRYNHVKKESGTTDPSCQPMVPAKHNKQVNNNCKGTSHEGKICRAYAKCHLCAKEVKDLKRHMHRNHKVKDSNEHVSAKNIKVIIKPKEKKTGKKDKIHDQCRVLDRTCNRTSLDSISPEVVSGNEGIPLNAESSEVKTTKMLMPCPFYGCNNMFENWPLLDQHIQKCHINQN